MIEVYDELLREHILVAHKELHEGRHIAVLEEAKAIGDGDTALRVSELANAAGLELRVDLRFLLNYPL